MARTVLADYEMGNGWRQQWLGMHFGDQLQINDFGYLERNNFNYAHWEVRKRNTALPGDSAYSSHDWRCSRRRAGQRPWPAPAPPAAHQPQQRLA